MPGWTERTPWTGLLELPDLPDLLEQPSQTPRPAGLVWSGLLALFLFSPDPTLAPPVLDCYSTTRLDWSTPVLSPGPHFPPLPPTATPRAADTDNPVTPSLYACEQSHVVSFPYIPSHTKPYQDVLFQTIPSHTKPLQRHNPYQAIHHPIPSHPVPAQVQIQSRRIHCTLPRTHARLLLLPLLPTPLQKIITPRVSAGPPRRAQPKKTTKVHLLVQPSPAAHALPTHLPRSRR